MTECNNNKELARFGPEPRSGTVADGTDVSKYRVLIVDDEPMLRSVIQDFLLMLGFENQRVAGDGLEALDVLRGEPVDFMLSDIRMPKMELEELLGVIRKEFPRLIVIATSGFSDLESARNIFIKGAHDFIGKPLNLDALEVALPWMVDRQRILQRATTHFGAAAQPVAGAAAAAGLTALRETMLGGRHQFMERIHHAVRLADLLDGIETGLATAERVDLKLAALLHELGAGYQIQMMCRRQRELDDPERMLVRQHAPIAGRLAACYLERPEFQTIIGGHLQWQMTLTVPAERWAPLDHLAVWLGLLNSVLGYLSPRPDRAALSPGRLREVLAGKFPNPGSSPVGALLGQWDRVERFFSAECGMRSAE